MLSAALLGSSSEAWRGGEKLIVWHHLLCTQVHRDLRYLGAVGLGREVQRDAPMCGPGMVLQEARRRERHHARRGLGQPCVVEVITRDEPIGLLELFVGDRRMYAPPLLQVEDGALAQIDD